jgi:hypothetical protein
VITKPGIFHLLVFVENGPIEATAKIDDIQLTLIVVNVMQIKEGYQQPGSMKCRDLPSFDLSILAGEWIAFISIANQLTVAFQFQTTK